MLVDKNQFSIVRCDHCGFYYLNPRPDIKEMEKYYPKFYYNTDIEKESLLKKNQKILKRKYSKVKEYLPCKVLEIGAQKGEFLYYLKMKNPMAVVSGIDLDDSIPNLYKMDIKYGYAWDFNFAPESFQIIVMWEVLEHIHELNSLMRLLSDWLSSDGILILSVPNFRSVNKLLMRTEDIPRHLYMFTPKTIKQFVSKFNLEVFRIDHVRSIFPNTAKEYLVFLFKKIILRKNWDDIVIEYNHPDREKGNFLILLIRIFDRLITVPFQSILNILGFSSNMTVFIRKRNEDK